MRGSRRARIRAPACRGSVRRDSAASPPRRNHAGYPPAAARDHRFRLLVRRGRHDRPREAQDAPDAASCRARRASCGSCGFRSSPRGSRCRGSRCRRPTRRGRSPALDGPAYAALRWLAAAVAIGCLALTVRCWARMGKDWRMDVAVPTPSRAHHRRAVPPHPASDLRVLGPAHAVRPPSCCRRCRCSPWLPSTSR